MSSVQHLGKGNEVKLRLYKTATCQERGLAEWTGASNYSNSQKQGFKKKTTTRPQSAYIDGYNFSTLIVQQGRLHKNPTMRRQALTDTLVVHSTHKGCQTVLKEDKNKNPMLLFVQDQKEE